MPAYSHLLDEERDQIAVMRAAGRSICAIARALQRAKSTVSRELRRNGLSSGRYSPLHAAGAYQRILPTSTPGHDTRSFGGGRVKLLAA